MNDMACKHLLQWNYIAILYCSAAGGVPDAAVMSAELDKVLKRPWVQLLQVSRGEAQSIFRLCKGA